MSDLVEKEIGPVSRSTAVVVIGTLVSGGCFVSEKSTVHTAS